MEMLQDLSVGPKCARLMVGNIVIPAEALDDRLRHFEPVAGQPREEVVLDLIVEAPVPEVGDRVGQNVAAGQHLAAKEANLAVLLQKRHGLVVGREDRDHEQTEQPAMDGHEKHGLQRFEKVEQQAEVQREVDHDEGAFGQRSSR